jgi:hypothetical protein
MSSEKLARSWTISCTTQRGDSITLPAGRIGPGRTAGRPGTASPIGEVSRRETKYSNKHCQKRADFSLHSFRKPRRTIRSFLAGALSSDLEFLLEGGHVFRPSGTRRAKEQNPNSHS